MAALANASTRGLVAGCILWLFQKYQHQRPSAPTDYMEAFDAGDGRLDVSASLVKSLASLIVVSSGSAIGREGAMILLAALFASIFARYFTPFKEWKLWVACGAAAGMASAYHAPLAGSLFIAEILFGSLMLASLGPVVISAVSALLMSNLLNGGQKRSIGYKSSLRRGLFSTYLWQRWVLSQVLQDHSF